MGRISGAGLKTMGLLNAEALDLSELQSSRTKAQPYCVSKTCTTYQDSEGKMKCWKRVSRDDSNHSGICPYCNFALIWQ
jgi:hypothetical protein